MTEEDIVTLGFIGNVYWNWPSRLPDLSEIPEGVFIIQCDAAHKEGIAGICSVIKTHNKEYKPIDCAARTKGPIHAELMAIYKALKRINTLSKEIKVCVIYSDNKYACLFIGGNWSRNRDYIKSIMEKIDGEMDTLRENGTSVFVCHIKSKHNKRVDRRALKKRKREESKKQKQIEERIEKVEAAIVKSREILVTERDGEFFARPIKGGFPPGFRVSLDPPHCGCPWWKHNWASKGERIIKARALPCKHICALTDYLDLDVYDVFSHQIERVD